MDEDKRNLSDEDVEALAEAMERRLVRRFYLNLGAGVWGMAWRVICGVIVLIALWGAYKGGKFF